MTDAVCHHTRTAIILHIRVKLFAAQTTFVNTRRNSFPHLTRVSPYYIYTNIATQLSPRSSLHRYIHRY